jgi:hypothetical protein
MPISKVGSKGIKDAELSAADIAPGTITSDKIASGTIAADRLAGGITNTQLAGSIETSKLAGSITNAKLSNSSITVNGTAIALGASGDIVAGLDWQSVKTADFTAVSGEGYFVNTAGGAITVTLPASPSIGDFVGVVDYGSAATNNITIARNGSNFNAAASNRVTNGNRVSEVYVYSDATVGWTVQSTSIEPASFVEATGGTTANSGDYKIHTFNSSGNFAVTSIGNQGAIVDYLVVAGGGGGGEGGGGAGGYRESNGLNVAGASPLANPTGITIAAQTYPITIGAGGGGQEHQSGGLKGGNSIFSTITSTGGGGGGPAPNPRVLGGSGGGREPGVPVSCQSGNHPPVSPPQGNPGGVQGNNSNPGRHGGGGGAIEAGCTDGSSHGGDGAASSISGSAVTRAGGGGGGYSSAGAPVGSAPGGDGGGGSGSTTNGTAAPGSNLGGGGGGGWNNGANGSSGVVILRYKRQ